MCKGHKCMLSVEVLDHNYIMLDCIIDAIVYWISRLNV